MTGGKLAGPIDEPYVALTDLDHGDTAVWVGRGDHNGKFTIPNVPDGSYTLTWWDEPQDYILDLQNVTVVNGEVVDLGVLAAQRLVDRVHRLRLQRRQPQRRHGLDRHQR